MYPTPALLIEQPLKAATPSDVVRVFPPVHVSVPAPVFAPSGQLGRCPWASALTQQQGVPTWLPIDLAAPGGRTLLFGGAIMCVGTVLFPCTHSTTMLFASRVLIGFGSSFVYLRIVKELDTLFAPRHFAGLLGLAMLAGYVGNIAATLPFERAVHSFGWRDTLLAVQRAAGG